MLFNRRQSVATAASRKLIVGLGNIGAAYVGTRHNIGFEVADELACHYKARWRKGRRQGEEAEILIREGDAPSEPTGEMQRVLLLKPHTLMNLSGDAVSAALRFYRIPVSDLLVVCDDIYLPVGAVRIRASGGDGGHNGLWHISNCLGTQEYARLRLGVGAPPPEMDMADYVLSRFVAAERTPISEAISHAASAAETWATKGMTAAMNHWNAPETGQKKPVAPTGDEE